MNRWFLLYGPPVLRHVPWVRDLPMVHGYFWVRRIDLPAADCAVLERAVNRDTVAFMGPNHPEFATDWLVDKEISTLVAPRMASWADRGIVSIAPRFWGMNNLIANDGGDAARNYSVEWAIKGEGVLLHPEGAVRWTNDRVHRLFPGIVHMALRAAERTDRPVYIVPLVWKYRFTGDVTARLHREMRLIESGLGLPRGDLLPVPARFAALQENVLATQMRTLGYDDCAVEGDFFDRQLAFQRALVADLESRYRTTSTDEMDRRIARLARTIREELSAARRGFPAELVGELRGDLRRAEEAKRLGEMSRDVYGGSTLSQEQLSESLKRLRDRMLARGWRDTLARMLPRPLGPRVVHVGVPEPIRVERVTRDERTSYEEALLELTRASMQDTLDAINRRIEPEVAPFRHP
ncbi:MAG: hypothetical protein JWN53_1385, partial [Gemmatimonadetes bacterium]|nr:hypothetical protein [Gemmatimonadota bacterium]